jgi:hypothetical protein
MHQTLFEMHFFSSNQIHYYKNGKPTYFSCEYIFKGPQVENCILRKLWVKKIFVVNSSRKNYIICIFLIALYYVRAP